MSRTIEHNKIYWQRFKTFEERFWEKVDRRGPDECWNWLGSKNGKGYGSFYANGKMNKAHVISYEMNVGPIHDGLFVCHKCDNPPCVNPNHLFLGTNQDNIKDMFAKGRFPDHKGENHPGAKLTEHDVLEIRRLRESGYSMNKLAKMFSVDVTNINLIVKRRHWVHI